MTVSLINEMCYMLGQTQAVCVLLKKEHSETLSDYYLQHTL